MDPVTASPDLVDLSRALASLCGVEGLPMRAETRVLAESVGAHDHLVLALLDGAGLNLVERLSPKGFFRRHLSGALDTVFLSSTAPALTSLYTGEYPARHAVPAWWTHLPSIATTATILPFVERFEGGPLPIAPQDVFPVAPLFPRYQRDFCSFLPASICESVYSRHVRGGTPAIPYRSLRTAVDGILDQVRSSRPTFSYLYHSDVDTAEHVHGWRSDEAREALQIAERELERLQGKARLIVTADHGHMDVEDFDKILLPPDDPLLRWLRCPPSGEPRVPMFHVRPGCETEFESEFARRFGKAFRLVSVARFDADRCFGPDPLVPEMRNRIGDYAALADDPRIFLYGPPRYHRHEALFRGWHGGRTPDEVRIPLIVS